MLQQPCTKISNPKAFSAITLALVCSVLMFSGCQAMKSKFGAMPKLPTGKSLAFWKKESDSLPPPPPAQHLSPSPTDGIVNGTRSALAQSDSKVDIDDYQRKIDEIKSGIASTKNKMSESFESNKPIRTPYDGKGFGLEQTGNSIDKGLAEAKEMGTNSLSDAQQKFNSAVASVQQPATSGGGFKSPSEILSTKPANDFKDTLAAANAKLKSGAKSTFKEGGFNQSLAKVNQSLYDMNGQLRSGSGAVAKKTESTVDAARQRFSSALGSVGDRAKEATKSSTEFGANLKDKIVSAATEMKPTLPGGDNSFKPSFTRAADAVTSESQSLLSKAKERVSEMGGGFGSPSQSRPSFVAVAPKTVNPERIAPPANQGGTFDRTRVANVTPAASQATSNSTFGQRSGLESTLTKAWNGGEKQSQLQPIQVGPPKDAPGNGLRTASLQTNKFERPAAASIPAAFDQAYNTMASHVREIEIPNKILSGSGNYAPGSVNKVR